MAANYLTANGSPQGMEGNQIQMGVTANAVIYQNAHVILTSGYIARASDASSSLYVGISRTQTTTGTSTNGGVTVMVETIGPTTQYYAYPVASGVAAPTAATWIGNFLSIIDDNGSVELNAASTNHVNCGRCVAIIDSTGGLNSNGLVIVDRLDRATYSTGST